MQTFDALEAQQAEITQERARRESAEKHCLRLIEAACHVSGSQVDPRPGIKVVALGKLAQAVHDAEQDHFAKYGDPS